MTARCWQNRWILFPDHRDFGRLPHGPGGQHEDHHGQTKDQGHREYFRRRVPGRALPGQGDGGQNIAWTRPPGPGTWGTPCAGTPWTWPTRRFCVNVRYRRHGARTCTFPLTHGSGSSLQWRSAVRINGRNRWMSTGAPRPCWPRPCKGRRHCRRKRPEIYAFLVGDIGRGDGSRLLYESHLPEHLPEQRL